MKLFNENVYYNDTTPYSPMDTTPAKYRPRTCECKAVADYSCFVR